MPRHRMTAPSTPSPGFSTGRARWRFCPDSPNRPAPRVESAGRFRHARQLFVFPPRQLSTGEDSLQPAVHPVARAAAAVRHAPHRDLAVGRAVRRAASEIVERTAVGTQAETVACEALECGAICFLLIHIGIPYRLSVGMPFPYIQLYRFYRKVLGMPGILHTIYTIRFRKSV